MASVAARRVLRDRARANRAASRERRAALIAAHRIRKAARSLTTHVIAAGFTADVVTGAVNALRNQARKTGILGVAARIRRSFTGRHRLVHIVKRYTRAQVAQLAENWKPRKAEYKTVRAALIAV
ncbi:hypothetical protein [Streptomyces ardesiacus]|uniref:hypothetical protein n=1 Tax=Streptomyces ardesiacus TaxID=285564 RepID=UPI000D59E045|nr:hypothetical protein [Streptomyces ardesiacus]